MEKLEEYEKAFGIHETNPHRPNDVQGLLSLCKVNELENSIEEIYEKYEDKYNEFMEIYNELKNENFSIFVRINRVLEVTYYAQSISVGLKRIHEAIDHTNDFRDNTDASLFRFRGIDIDQNSKYQNFLLFILKTFYERGYFRYNENVYKVIINKNGYNTQAYQHIGNISDVIYKSVRKETNYEQFLNMTSNGNNVKQATEFLSQCCDSQFPVLNKNRHIFSFQNGIYFADQDKFVKYEDTPETCTSSKYFPLEFKPEENYEDIETPYFDQIFEYQGLDEETIDWIYAFTGRLIYSIDEKDGWQVIPFIQGQAGTGKSTYVLNVCKEFYSDEDVGVMSNNIQRTFGLADLVDKMMYVAPEIKRDFNIEQGEFQSIVSGDKVNINIKYKNSRTETWTIPGVMAGNECPDFIDNAGSIQRRLLTVKFGKKVYNNDLLLGRKLKKEIPNIIQKCNKSYLQKAELYGRKNIWSVVPSYFKEIQKEIATATNPLIHFLDSENIIINKNEYIPAETFKERFKEHCRNNNFNPIRFTSQFYQGPFAQFNITVTSKENREYPIDSGSYKNCIYYEGVGFNN